MKALLVLELPTLSLVVAKVQLVARVARAFLSGSSLVFSQALGETPQFPRARRHFRTASGTPSTGVHRVRNDLLNGTEIHAFPKAVNLEGENLRGQQGAWRDTGLFLYFLRGEE